MKRGYAIVSLEGDIQLSTSNGQFYIYGEKSEAERDLSLSSVAKRYRIKEVKIEGRA